MHRLPPEAGGLQDVGLVDADDVLPALPGGFKGHPGNALDLHDGVRLGVIGLGAVLPFPAAALAKVDAAGELPHHDHVKAVCHDVRPQGAVPGQRGINLGRAQVGEEPQRGAKPQECLLRAEMAGVLVPLGAAHGAQEHAVGIQAALDSLLGQGDAGFIDGAAAGEIGRTVEGVAVLLADFLQDADGAVHNFGADAVALDECNLKFHGSASLSVLPRL